MTLSNFDWTDKDSKRWFILLPNGHEGPYSFNNLVHLRQNKKITEDVSVWAEGLPGPLSLRLAFDYQHRSKYVEQEEFVTLPPVPQDEDIPPIPVAIEESTDIQKEEKPQENTFRIPVWLPVVLIGGGLFFFSMTFLAKTNEKFNVRRLPKMTVELHKRILQENTFDGWGKPPFFKEYLPHDHSHIWLVTSSYHQCDIETTFTSLKDKLLTMKDEKVSFRSHGQLNGHVAELASFEFTSGSRLIPGLYEMDVKAINCEWEGLIPEFMNAFQGPDKEYLARTKVVLFSQGPGEFQKTLEGLLKKKFEMAEFEKNTDFQFWQDLQQKFQTLEAISLQIEQHFLDFLDQNPAGFKKNLNSMVDNYTTKFGSFLTTFVVQNEKNLGEKGDSEKRNYELMVRLTSKKVGLESMQFIEEFQKLKAPTEKELLVISDRVKKAFSGIKKDIRQKLSQVSEDQVK
jgi:hypothetical protein